MNRDADARTDRSESMTDWCHVTTFVMHGEAQDEAHSIVTFSSVGVADLLTAHPLDRTFSTGR